MKLQWKKWILCISLPLITGALSGFLARDGFADFASLPKPPLTPPGWLFPIVWTILYILMGISSYLIWISGHKETRQALTFYFLQLFLNFLWPVIFFRQKEILFAFVILAALWIFIFLMIFLFRIISPKAAKLQIPYLIWTAFAGYLNLGIYLLM